MSAAVRTSQKGDSFFKLVQCFARAEGSTGLALDFAQKYVRTNPEVVEYFRAAVNAGSINDANFAGPMAQFSSISNEFIELVRGRSVIGRLPEARHVPLRTQLAVEIAAAGAYWRSSGTTTPKPISRMSFASAGSLEAKTAVAIVVLTGELLERSGAQRAIGDALVRSVAAFLDASLLDPSFGSSTNSPTSITNAGTTVTPSGTSAMAVADDLRSMVIAVAAAVPQLLAPVFVASPLAVTKLSALRDSAGSPAFPGLNINSGGNLIGVPLMVSAAAQSADSPTEDVLVLFDQTQVLLADSNEVRLDVAKEADLVMDSVPSGGAQQMTSLWQHNMVAVRVERVINWSMGRPAAAATLTVTF